MAQTPVRRDIELASPGVAATINHIRRLEQGLRLIAREIEAATGASAAQLFILELLANGEGMSLRELSIRTFTDRSSVSEVVDRLVAGGLAARRVSAHDRRRADVRITSAGRRALASAPTTPARRLIDALQSLPARSRRDLSVGLDHLNRALKLDGKRPRLLFEETRPRSGARSRR